MPQSLSLHQRRTHPSRLYRIKVSDLDVNLHTNNVRYLTWVSDCYDLDFVMKNFPRSAEINYLAESQFDEEIVIKTSEEKIMVLFITIQSSEPVTIRNYAG